MNDIYNNFFLKKKSFNFQFFLFFNFFNIISAKNTFYKD